MKGALRAWCLAVTLGGGAALAGPPRLAALDPEASEARILVEMRLAGEVRGRFERIEGELVALPDGRWQVRVRLDARRLVLDGPDWRVRMTRSEKFLDVENHPDIRFTSSPFDGALLGTGGRLDGALRLRGRERPVSFALDPAACPAPGPGCTLHVSGQISRREFGMEAYRLWVQDGVAFDFLVHLREPDTP
ncbi:YceI family protein [Arenimonas fontis]|uniref:YceI family protein n=1 Tax=Arenimonas fontis TaxID=2608255 RepID=A0A5B2ZB48_9GAMM|nr:YceI family protein [Arenimonas fontis]KAA2284773.1 YceI family protein [Arenimonas fontis]